MLFFCNKIYFSKKKKKNEAPKLYNSLPVNVIGVILQNIQPFWYKVRLINFWSYA